MIHIKGDGTQRCFTPGLIQNQFLTSFPILSAAALFSYMSFVTLMYLSGILYKDKTFAKALLSTESNAWTKS